MRTYTAVVERDPETGLYVGYVPGFPGAHSQGESLDELQANWLYRDPAERPSQAVPSSRRPGDHGSSARRPRYRAASPPTDLPGHSRAG